METGNHFKNAANPKSLTSRGNLLQRIFLLFAVFWISASGMFAQDIKKDEWKILWMVFTNTQFSGVSTSISDEEYDKIYNQAIKFETFVEKAAPWLDLKITVVKNSAPIIKTAWDINYGPFLQKHDEDVFLELNKYGCDDYDAVIVVADLTALRSQTTYAGLSWGWDLYSFIPFFRDLPLQDEGYPWFEPHTEQVFVHEWLHQIEWWFGSLGYTVPDLHDNATYGFPNSNENGWGDWYNAYLRNELQGGVSTGIHPDWWKLSPTKLAASTCKTPPDYDIALPAPTTEWQRGSFHIASDACYVYRVEVTSGASYEFNIRPQLNTKEYLYDGSGTLLAESSPLGDAQNIRYEFNYSGYAYVQVEGESSGNYDYEYRMFHTYTVMASAGSGGKIEPSGLIPVVNGNAQTFTFTPDNGYEIDQVLVDDIVNTAAKESRYYIFPDVTNNHTIHVTFKPDGTPSITPPIVITQAATNITQTTATLNKSVTSGSETITEQGFEYKTPDASSWQTSISGTLTNLTANTEYQFRAYAKTASGTTYGNTLTFSTVSDVPAQPLTITSPTYGATYQCGDWVNIFVSGYTGADWQEALELHYSCLVGEPQPTNDDEPSICKFTAYPRAEDAYSFTFSPETPSIWAGHWVKLIAHNKKDDTWSAPQYIRIAAISYDMTVSVSEGNLCTQVGVQKLNITSLKVTGYLNGTDILCLREMAGSDINGGSSPGNLAILDLKDAFIVSGGGYYYNINNILYYPTSNNTIGDYMFYNCSKLKSITLPSSVTSIEGYAFQFSGLTGISIPSNITSISSYAFANCVNLAGVTIENGPTTLSFSGYNTFTGSNIKTLHLGRNISNSTSSTSIPFYGKNTLTSLTMSGYVTSIGYCAFQGCSGLSAEVTIPSSVTSIGVSAFDGCVTLSAVTIGENVETIESSAFNQCRALTAVTIPPKVTTIGGGAFSNCDNLANVTIENGPTTLSFSGANTFTGSNIKTLHLGRNISNSTSSTSIPFYGKNTLTSLTIGRYVTSIGYNAFYDSGLKEIHSLNPTPPNATLNCFSNVYATCTLYVPAGGSFDLYKVATEW